MCAHLLYFSLREKKQTSSGKSSEDTLSPEDFQKVKALLYPVKWMPEYLWKGVSMLWCSEKGVLERERSLASVRMLIEECKPFPVPPWYSFKKRYQKYVLRREEEKKREALLILENYEARLVKCLSGKKMGTSTGIV
jgi:hypothetical protein